MFYTIYKITNIINGKIYIGAHQTENLNDDYMGSGRAIKRALEIYGIENLKKEYFGFFDSAQDMFQMESRIVNKDFIGRKDTYNLKEGGLGGDTSEFINYDEEYSEKLKEAYKNSSKNAQRRQKIREKALERYKEKGPFEGKKHSVETKKKIGDANAKHQRGIQNSHYGKCWVYSLIEKRSISIKKEDLEIYLKEDWIKGRKMNFD